MSRTDFLNALIAIGAKLPALFALIQQIIALFTPADATPSFAASNEPADELEAKCCEVMAANAPLHAAGGGGGLGVLTFLAQLRAVWQLLEANPAAMSVVQALLKALGVG